VVRNAEQAYFWSTLAAKQNEKNAERRRAILAAQLSTEAVARAQKSAGEWKPVLATAR
jgi:hypothetical protein